MCQPRITYSLLYVPIINTALDGEGGVFQDYAGYERSEGFDFIIDAYRATSKQHNITAKNTHNANGCDGAVRQIDVFRLNPELHLLVDPFGQRVAHAI